MVDFGSLKSSLLSSEGPHEDHKVEVNQRHLIDKILARYSAEFTIYREVLQNANDAGAKRVVINFDVDEDENILTLKLENDGRPFNSQDWQRLRKIAEGNPDEDKIGFFGVGFYSLFSVADEPMVLSSNDCMGFYWKGDQLYTRSLKLDALSMMTAIFLECRDKLPLPDMESFAEFVGKSLTFTKCLEKIEIHVNGTKQFVLSKALIEQKSLQISMDNLKPIQGCVFRLKPGFHQSSYQISFEKHYTTKPKKKSLLFRMWKTVTGSALGEETFRKTGSWESSFSLVQFHLESHLSKEFSNSFQRITKKPPSPSFEMSLLLPYSYSSSSQTETHPVLRGILPINSQGKVFIGFETHQTTSGCFHLAGPFIPTVERESLDFVDPTLKQWNQSLLIQSGVACRLVYNLYAASKDCDFDVLFKIFGFQVSSPSPHPGNILCDIFFTCCKLDMMLPSTTGIQSLENLRVIPKSMRCFLKLTPQLLLGDSEGSKVFFENLGHYFNLSEAGIVDLLHELKARAVTDTKEIASILQWTSDNSQMISRFQLDELASCLKVPTGTEDECHLVFLSNVKCIPGRMLFNAPYLPTACLAPDFITLLNNYRICDLFGLYELDVEEWFSLVVKQPEFRSKSVFVESILIFLSTIINKISLESMSQISRIGQVVPFMPTNKGLLLPSLTFFENVDLLENLPKLKFDQRSRISDSLLKAFGVKSHLPVADIFANLQDWDIYRLVEYLITVQDDITSKEYELLSQVPIFPDQYGGKQSISSLFLSTTASQVLNLPLLQWPIALSEGGRVTMFLVSIGLQVKPPLKLLLKGISIAPLAQQLVLLDYLALHFSLFYSDEYASTSASIPFVPTTVGVPAAPMKCFQDSPVALLGFPVVQADILPYASLLRIPRRPGIDVMVKKFLERKYSVNSASDVFAFMATSMNEIPRSLWKLIQSTPIIPVSRKDNVVWCKSDEVFFGFDDDSWQNIFVKVDFGESANAFLRAAGVKDKPSALEVTRKLAADPSSLLRLLGQEAYIGVLRRIAINWESILGQDKAIIDLLNRSHCLIGFHTVEQNDEEDFEKMKIIGHLCRPADVFLVDDSLSLRIFDIHHAPNETILENLYRRLGSKWISEVVEQTWSYRGDPQCTQEASNLQQEIRRRCRLLISECKGSMGGVHPDAASILNDIQVLQVDSISTTRTFGEKSHSEKLTACMLNEGIILITVPFDAFDIGAFLAKIICKSPKLNDSLLLSTLLSMPFSSLKAKGFPVEMLYNKTQASIEPNPLPEPPLVEETSQRIPSQQPGTFQQRQEEKGTNRVLRSGDGHKSWYGKLKKFFQLEPSSSGRNLKESLQRSVRKCVDTKEDKFTFSKPTEHIELELPSLQDVCRYPDDVSFNLIGKVESIDIFLDARERQPQEWLMKNIPALESFARILVQVGNVFDLKSSQLSIFFVTNTDVIAFNRANGLFFGFGHYLAQMRQNMSALTVMASWYVTMAHELAHNFTSNHDKEHEFFMSSYIETYMENFMHSLGK